jgi:Mrp family chromosome partitioning ATPase
VLEGVEHVLLVASGKGGVGKSTVAANLAQALAAQGKRVGLLDADIYGPSMPTMFRVNERVASSDGKTLDPVVVSGIKLMSMGFFVPPEAAMVWRGPMLHGAVTQFLRDVNWGELDVLVVDLPPGTGDVQLSFAQQLSHAAAVIVSTPQLVALADVIRARGMFDRVSLPVIGLVENMAYFLCDGCDKEHDLFGRGGAKAAAEELNLPFLAEIPLDPAVSASGDAGTPLVSKDPSAAVSRAFAAMAERAFEETVRWRKVIEERRARSLVARNRGELGPDTSLQDACELCPPAPDILVDMGMPEPGEDERLDGGVPLAAVADRWDLDLDELLDTLNRHLKPAPAADKKGKLPVLTR